MNPAYVRLIFHRAMVDMKAEASQNYIGMVWWVLEPLLYLVAFYTIFEIFLQRGGPGFVGFLLTGLVFWRWFATSVSRGGISILGSGGLINQIYLPKYVFPLTEVVGACMRFCLVLCLFLVFIGFYGVGPTLGWLSLPLLMLVQLTIIIGFTSILSVAVALFPDFRKVTENLMLLMFYMSGIFFDTSRLGTEIQSWLNLNPMAVLIREYREVLLYGHLPQWDSLINVLIAGCVLSLIGLLWLRRMDLKLPNYVS